MYDQYGMAKQQEKAAKSREKDKKKRNAKQRSKWNEERTKVKKEKKTAEARRSSLEEELAKLEQANTDIFVLFDEIGENVTKKISEINNNKVFIEPNYAGDYVKDIKREYKGGIKYKLNTVLEYFNYYSENYEIIKSELDEKIENIGNKIAKLNGRILQIDYIIDVTYAD